MNLADLLVILILVSMFTSWIYFKNRKAKDEVPSRCKGCANFKLCNKKKDDS